MKFWEILTKFDIFFENTKIDILENLTKIDFFFETLTKIEIFKKIDPKKRNFFPKYDYNRKFSKILTKIEIFRKFD